MMTTLTEFVVVILAGGDGDSSRNSGVRPTAIRVKSEMCAKQMVEHYNALDTVHSTTYFVDIWQEDQS